MEHGLYFYHILQCEDKYRRLYSIIAIIAPFTLFVLFLFWAYMTPGLSNDALAISLAIGLGFIGLITTVFLSLSDKVRDFFLESKKGQIDEKIAILYSHALTARTLTEQNRYLMVERMAADIRSIGRLRKSIRDEQLENILSAKDVLISEIRTVNQNDADRLLRVFQSFYL
jgi:hypothetical protein